MIIEKTHIIRWLELSAAVLNQNKAYLTELDSPIGDADHGSNVARGFGQIVEKLPTVADKDLGVIFKSTAMTVMSAVGGASGLLYGNFFMRASMVAAGKEALTEAELVQMLENGRDGIVQRGRAELGDKTMIDAWTPALAALSATLAAGADFSAALAACTVAAEQGMKATIPMQARKGRASYLGERSIGHQDPGATSTYMILDALRRALI